MGALSLQKLSANRRNAQLSTGPKTALGKAKSALNAVKHGIFTKECLKDIPDEEVRDYEALRLGVFESLKPKDQMQAILCDKVTIDAWHLRKVLAFEQGAMQLETLKLDASGSPVNFSDRKAIIYNMENNKSESENLNQLKKWLTAKGDANFSDLSNKACWLLEEIVQTFPRKLQAYRRRAFEKL